MIRGIAVVALVAGCGTSRDKGCTITVSSITAEMANGHAELTGSFDAGQPLMILTLGGTMHVVACTVAGATADCDVGGQALAPGTYQLAFDVTCNAPGVDTGTVIANAAPTFVVN